MDAMQISDALVTVRRTRDVRLVEHGGRVIAYPEPHRTPVLPRGWAPLSREQQDALLGACDAAPDCLVFRLGSVWELDCEYRVYCLTTELWTGLSVATKSNVGLPVQGRGVTASAQRSRRLLGLSHEPAHAVRIAVDFFNWDLEAQGQSWRLGVSASAADAS